MDTRINYKLLEEKWQTIWAYNKCFESVPNEKIPFTMILPPPNVTGVLHMGHALNSTFQDIRCRYQRMKGYNVLWVPGLDHAGLATQIKVINQLKSDNIDPTQLSRDELIKHIFDWTKTHKHIIVNQLKQLGCSCDWSNQKFTLDDFHSNQVNEIFIKLYNDGLIYQGLYMVNWCPALATAISDEETIKTDTIGKLYYIKYKIVDRDQYLVVATSRPETIFGDSAIAFHPQDPRFIEYKDCKVYIPIINKEIGLIADTFVTPEFGSGLVKITPAHNKDDYEIGKRHNLPINQVIDKNGNLYNTETIYDGISREIVKKMVVKELTKLGLIEKIEDYNTIIKTCSRSGSVIEPMLTTQWFVKMKPLAEICRKFIDNGEITLFPERHINHLYNWLDNIHDWCISRQIVWGHRIPIYYCQNKNCAKILCSNQTLETCSLCQSSVEQDKDVLDTWFSSWILPYTDLGSNLNYYFPIDVLITGEDILFFWVIKMIMASGYMYNKVPFKKVFLHGLVRDENKVKMTKTLGNVINPLTIIEKYGTDPMRFSLIMHAPKEHDFSISFKMFDSGKNFCTKFWNIVRFCLDNAKNEEINLSDLDDLDKEILNKLNMLILKIEKCLAIFDYQQCGQCLHTFVFTDFSNSYLESTKNLMNNNKENKQKVLFHILNVLTRILSPFIPHVAEEIWEILNNKFNHSTTFVSLTSFPEIFNIIS